jgi:hypothetical protein
MGLAPRRCQPACGCVLVTDGRSVRSHCVGNTQLTVRVAATRPLVDLCLWYRKKGSLGKTALSLNCLHISVGGADAHGCKQEDSCIRSLHRWR